MDYQVYYELIPFFLLFVLCYLGIRSNEYIQVRRAELREETKQKAKENYLQNDLYLQKLELANDLTGFASEDKGIIQEILSFAASNPDLVKQYAPKIKLALDNMKK